MKRHLRTHRGEKLCECDICHARFARSNSLKAHRTIHMGNNPVSKRPMQCEMCGKRFPVRNALKVHEKTHTRERSSKCDSCPYNSISQHHMEAHMLNHTNQRPNQCEVCGKKCSGRNPLKVTAQEKAFMLRRYGVDF